MRFMRTTRTWTAAATAATLLLVLLLATARSTTAQTRSPTRKPTTPPPPLCAIYGQLPQILNGAGQAESGDGHGVATNADASIVAVLSAQGNVTIYSRPAGSPTSTLYTKSAVIDIYGRFGLIPVKLKLARVMSMTASGDTIVVGSTDPTQLPRLSSDALVVLRATSRAFKTFNASVHVQQDAGISDLSYFAMAVSVSRGGTYIAVGAPFYDVDTYELNGAVALYRLGGKGAKPWEYGFEALLFPNALESHAYVGVSVDVTDNGVVLAGAVGFAGTVGAAYTFARTVDGAFAQQGPVVVNPTGASFSGFGVSVALDKKGLIAAVGNSIDDSVGFQMGSVSFMARSSLSTTWGPPQRLVSPNQVHAEFGYSVAMSEDGNLVVAGSPMVDINEPGISGAWVRFNRNTTTGLWQTSNAYASPGPLAPGDSSTYLGASVAVSSDGSTVVVGSPNRASAGGEARVGAVEVWTCGVAP